jgi:hypothetical protein
MKPWVHAFTVLAVALGACSPSPDSDEVERGANATPGSSLTLELVREHGSLDGTVAFGQIAGLAANERGLLAVSDATGCVIWIFDPDGTHARTIGGCGDGPGEIRSATILAFDRDNLLVYDPMRETLQELTPEGEELWRRPVNLLEQGVMWIGGLGALGGDTLVAGLDLLPAGVLPFHDQVALVRRSDVSPMTTALPASGIALTTPYRIVRPGPLCLSGRGAAGQTVVALNAWAPELTLLDPSDLSTLRKVSVPLEWVGPQERTGRPGYFMPHNPMPRVVCGRDHAVAAYRLQDRNEDGSWTVTQASLAVVELATGQVTLTRGPDDLLPQMTPGAGAGDRFYFFTNGFHDYPVVREYRLVPS